VAGVIEAENCRPFLWQAGVVTPLPLVPDTSGSVVGQVTGINASGAVVGLNGVYRGAGYNVGVRWEGGIVTELNLPWGGTPTAINDHGQIAISGYYYYTGQSAVLTGGATNVAEVAVGRTTLALDLNNAGQVCGRFIDASGGSHAFLWQGGIGTPLPEFLPYGLASQSEAVALNNLGHAVGQAANDSGSPAVIWRDGLIISLSDLPEVKAAGWAWLTARDINAHDQIVGIGSHGGFVTAFLLSPVTAPPPSLTITRSGANTIIVAWPAPAKGWVLEGTNALPSVAVASWPPVQLPYQTNAGTISVTFTNTPPVGNQFFRLHKP
jgi:probable HAF family extracellular repeat protein